MTLNNFPCIEGNTITSETTTDNSLRYFVLTDSVSSGKDSREYSGLTFSDYLTENELTYMSISGEISDYNHYTTVTRITSSITVTASSNDYIYCYGGTLTVSNFTSSTSCIKHVFLSSTATTISLGSSWTLEYDGSNIIAHSILILDWNGSSGVANIAVPTWDYYNNPYFEFKIYSDCSEANCLLYTSSLSSYIRVPTAVLINGVLTDQTFTSVTASAGDTITLCMYDPDYSSTFPDLYFSLYKKTQPVIYEILSPLPRTLDESCLVDLFSYQSRLTYLSIPEDLYKYFTVEYRTDSDGDVDTIPLDEEFMGCARLTKFPTEIFGEDLPVYTIDSTFEESGISTVLEGQFASLEYLRSASKTFKNCDLTTIGDSLFPSNSIVTDFSYLFYNADGIGSSSVTLGDIFADSVFVGSEDSTISTLCTFSGLYITAYTYDSFGDYLSKMDDPYCNARCMFYNDTKLATISRYILAYTGVYRVDYCFSLDPLKYSYVNGSSSSNRYIYFYECPDITNCEYFSYGYSKKFTVYLISGSTSYTTFKNSSTSGVSYTTI